MTEEEIKQAEINSMQEKEMKLIKQIHEIVWDSGLTPEEIIDEIREDLCEEFAEWERKGYGSFIEWRNKK